MTKQYRLGPASVVEAVHPPGPARVKKAAQEPLQRLSLSFLSPVVPLVLSPVLSFGVV